MIGNDCFSGVNVVKEDNFSIFYSVIREFFAGYKNKYASNLMMGSNR